MQKISKFCQHIKLLSNRSIAKEEFSGAHLFVVPVQNEKGYVLIISLMILAILVVLGIAGLNTTNTEIRISANDKVYKQAFYNADAGLSYAVQAGMVLFPPAVPGVLTTVVPPADLAAASPGTTLQYYDNSGSPRRVEVWSTGKVPGGGEAQVVGGLVTITTGNPTGSGTGETDQYGS